MNLLNHIMSYDKTKLNQENCNCEECVSSETVKSLDSYFKRGFSAHTR